MPSSTRSTGLPVTLTRSPERAPEATIPISESTARPLGAAAVLAIGVIHILDSVSSYQSSR